ncbi:hypothetical protein P8C59_007415 [Phyllachora maydis]|uniref:Uncharacterized protein n=1 Tax=Phyllachora maydis TaxID=1825666 RepID=A0AAD9MDI7_9PEZI|nr:hypothetical protein P8C59_007415 [Phyllachora maydis]
MNLVWAEEAFEGPILRMRSVTLESGFSNRPPRLLLGKVPPGLEASRGALYEIGVADDGTFVGLTKDELQESDSEMMPHTPGEVKRSQAKLWVAEALITPATAQTGRDVARPEAQALHPLLGTLSTGVFDNGRGKSRQNLLKHRHELASGVTSSVSQEILGYNGVDIVNYAHPDIESWIDIHDHVKDGRLVYLVDSAGHPRYRRTILRGMIGWAPHWTLFCMAADDGSTVAGPDGAASARDILGVTGAGVDLPSAHLDLCLQLKVPLVIVITNPGTTRAVGRCRTLGEKNAISASSIKSEWHDARIVSIRNLRLPVQTLEPGQVGSIGVVFDTPDQDGTADVTASAVHSIPSLRKGMILAVPSKHMLDTGLSLQAASGLTASFQGADAASLTAGSLVNIYVASVRAAARITRISHAAHSPNEGSGIATDDIDDVPPQGVEVQLELFTNREWIELGSQILLLEGGARDRSGLEGHVGKVMEIVD